METLEIRLKVFVLKCLVINLCSSRVRPMKPDPLTEVFGIGALFTFLLHAYECSSTGKVLASHA